MNDFVNIKELIQPVQVKRYPNGIWKHMKAIQHVCFNVEEIIAKNQGVFPTVQYRDPAIHTEYILETDKLIHQIDVLHPFIIKASGPELENLLSFIREFIFYYRIQSPVLIGGYINRLKDLLNSRALNSTLSSEDREVIESEIEYFQDVLHH